MHPVRWGPCVTCEPWPRSPSWRPSVPSSCLRAAAPTRGSSGTSAGPGDQLQVRPVSARHDKGLSLGPQVPKDVAAVLSKQTCPTDPKVFDDMVLECDARGSVFLLKDPIITGGVQSARATHIGNQKLWYVKVDLTPDAAAKMKAATASATGQEVAYSLGGKVLTTIPVDSQFDPSHLVVLGDYDEAQAKALATQLGPELTRGSARQSAESLGLRHCRSKGSRQANGAISWWIWLGPHDPWA